MDDTEALANGAGAERRRAGQERGRGLSHSRTPTPHSGAPVGRPETCKGDFRGVRWRPPEMALI